MIRVMSSCVQNRYSLNIGIIKSHWRHMKMKMILYYYIYKHILYLICCLNILQKVIYNTCEKSMHYGTEYLLAIMGKKKTQQGL